MGFDDRRTAEEALVQGRGKGDDASDLEASAVVLGTVGDSDRLLTRRSGPRLTFARG